VRGKLAMLELHIKESSHKTYLQKNLFFCKSGHFFQQQFRASGADAIKKFTPSLGIPYLGF